MANVRYYQTPCSVDVCKRSVLLNGIDIFQEMGIPLELVRAGDSLAKGAERLREGGREALLLNVTQNGEAVKTLTVDPHPVPDQAENILLNHEKGETALVLGETIRPRLRQKLRERGIMHADRRGNCFVQASGVIIDVRGATIKKPSLRSTGRKTKPTVSLFTPSRSKVIAMILSEPDLLGGSVREIACVAQVSTATVSQTLNLLLETGYLGRFQEGYRFKELEGLLSAWAREYSTGLGTRLQLFRGDGDVRRLSEMHPNGWVSGEQAVPEFLISGQTVHLYAPDKETLTQLVRSGRLSSNNEGSILVRSSFWKANGGLGEMEKQNTGHLQIESAFQNWPKAPMAIVYADLLAIGDPRLNEVAEELKAKIEEKAHRQGQQFG